MLDPAGRVVMVSGAALVAMALLLPGTTNVAELLVNCRLETSF